MKTWIEVALNGGVSRSDQSRLPVTADEIISDAVECVDAGAAIIHAHSLHPETGAQYPDIDNAAKFIEGVRGRTNAIVCPSPAAAPLAEGPERYKEMDVLAERGLIEWYPLDPGSMNWAMIDPSIDELDRLGGFGSRDVYYNNAAVLEAGMQRSAAFGFHCAYACFEPGFARLGASLHRRHPDAPMPIYRFMFSTRFTYGFPAREWALEAYAKLMEEVAPSAPWMIGGSDFDILPLIPTAVSLGAHVRVGLSDAPRGLTASNGDLVRLAVEAVQKAGGEPATAGEVRATIGGNVGADVAGS